MSPRIKRRAAVIENDTVSFDVSTNAHPNTWATVDLVDWPRVRPHRWSATKRKNALYVRNHAHGLLHRFILRPDDSLVVDHRDGNPLNNTRGNLRECTLSFNNQSGADRRRGYSPIVETIEIPTSPHVVSKRLADGTIKEYVYPTRSKTGTKTITRVNFGPIR